MSNETIKVPAGNAKVGDRVLCRVNGEMQDGWKVSQVGVINKDHYPLDIQIERKDGARSQVCPFDLEDIVIIPPGSEIPEPLRELATKNDFIVAREPMNTDEPRYRLVCATCHKELRVLRKEESIASLVFIDGRLLAYKFDSDYANDEVYCDCDDCPAKDMEFECE